MAAIVIRPDHHSKLAHGGGAFTVPPPLTFGGYNSAILAAACGKRGAEPDGRRF